MNQNENGSVQNNLSVLTRAQQEKAFAGAVEVISNQFLMKIPYMMIYGENWNIQGNICPVCAVEAVEEWIEAEDIKCWSESDNNVNYKIH